MRCPCWSLPWDRHALHIGPGPPSPGPCDVALDASSSLTRLQQCFHAGLLGTGSAFACSLVSVQASMAYAVAVSGIYWAASILLGGALIGLELYQRRGWLFPVLTVGLLMFHPYWTLPPLFGPDCVFFNVRTLLTAA